LRAVSGSVDKTVRVWNLEEGRCNATLEGHSDSVWGVAVTADGLRAVSGSDDNTVRVWDLKKGRCIATLHGHSDYVSSVAVAADGLRILSAAMNGVLRIWPMAESVKFGAIRAEDQRTYTNAKVVLVGESGVGKSGLAYRLIEDRFIETHSTHGMQVWQLDLPKAKKGSKEREALLWDLAGQEDYRIINQLFLDETALALALINPQKDDPFSDAVNWVKALRAAVTAKNPEREVAKLLIAARIDVGSIKVSQQKIDSFMQEHGFADYLPTSAQTGENCSDALNGGEPSALKKLVAAHIPWDTLPLTNTPLLLTEIKNAAFDMRDKKDVRLLRFSELCQRLESALPDQSFTNADVRTAVTLLANQGLVKPLKFGDLVLLKPEMLNGYAGAVIRAARKHKDEIGCVCEADIYDETFDFSGVERLERPDEELLLRAMVQTFVDESLCIAEDTPDGRQLIFPSQYRRERKIEKYPAIFVSYSFSGELQTIYTTLVVKLWYSREFEQKELWKDAVEFTTSKGKTVGFTMKSAGEGDGTISVFFEAGVPDELKWAFIKYVHDHLSRYACNVTRDRHYVCKCGKEVVDREAVRKRIAAKKKFIVCQDCDKKVVLIDHVETCLASDPVALRVLGMEKKAEQEKDTQALEQILIGHMMAICGEANQIFRPVSMFDYGIDGEVEFKDKDGKASGRKIYVQLKSGASYLRIRKSDGKEIFDVKNERHLEYWQNQPVDVYLVIRGEDEIIRWMNVTRYLKEREDKRSKQIIFEGERLDAPAIWRVRDQFFPKSLQK
jgi:small GTP-binding protein